MSIPKEPRQQMINIMYLVLTAMLALNISAEILNAFKTIDKSIDNSNTSVDKKVGDSMKKMAAAVEKNPFGEPYRVLADEAKKIGDETVAYIDEITTNLITVSNGPEHPDATDALNDRDKVTTTRILVEEGKATELKAKLEETKANFLALFDPAQKSEEGEDLFKPTDIESFRSQMAIEDLNQSYADEHGKPTTWERKNFNQMPVTPALALINKLKNDVKTSQSAAIEKLLGKVSEDELLFDKYLVGIVPNGTKFIQGEEFEVDVFLAASSSDIKPTIKINGAPRAVDADGVASYKSGRLNSVGEKNYSFQIDYVDTYGQAQTLKDTRKIVVVPPPDHVAVVSPTKMNVFYIGVDNPVSAAITGIPNKDVSVNMSGGTMTKAGGAGLYTVKVQKPGKATVNLSGKNQLGIQVNLSSEFRVKRIPDPIPEVGGKQGGKVGTGEWRAQKAVFAMLHDFDFDARFNVVGYEMTLAQRGQDLQICTNRGGKFEGECNSLQQKASVGDIYYLDNIKAKGPDGTTRTLPTISFKIK